MEEMLRRRQGQNKETKGWKKMRRNNIGSIFKDGVHDNSPEVEEKEKTFHFWPSQIAHSNALTPFLSFCVWVCVPVCACV